MTAGDGNLIRWTPIRTAVERDSLMDASLVLTALAIEHRMEKPDQHWQLLVESQNAQRAASELARYQEENRPVSIPPTGPRTMERGWVGVAAYLVAIWLLPTLESSQALSWDWRASGVMHAEAVVAGQWWRTVTALTLHGGLPHLLGNSLFGVAFGLFIGRHMGSGFGWLLILLAGAVGNGLNAFIQAEDFRSLGASTATFGALGIGATFFWRHGYFHGRSWKRNFAPVFAGITLLAFTGIGDENTDVIAHFMGFATGTVLGLGAASFDLRRLGKSGQYLSGGLAVGLLVTAWYLAGNA
jgi:rhomboid protease GluP